MLSIIVPVLNEALQIRPFLQHLRARAPGAEIIVVDGGSVDRTAVLARDLCDLLLFSGKGRARQLNVGAAAAKGDALWFVHVDFEIPASASAEITNALEDCRYSGGCFRVRIPDKRWVFRAHDEWAHWIGKMIRVRCGDHGIFCSRTAYDSIGGFRDVPLMEDAEFVRALCAHGMFAWLPSRLLLSARRHRQVGIYRYTFVCCAIVGLYCAGVPCQTLARIYKRLVRPRETARATELEVERELFRDFRDVPAETKAQKGRWVRDDAAAIGVLGD